MKLQVIFQKTPSPFSFHPLNVDMLENNAIVQNVVGTLFRLDRAHRRAPYLASSWETHDEGKVWSFKIREGLFCSDGTKINAINFKQSLERILKLRSQKNGTAPTLDLLEGWEDFTSGKLGDLKGLKAVDGDRLVFHFTERVEEELLAFLSLAHYGFFCDSDFDSNGNWKQQDGITSSGPYEIEQNSDNMKIIATRRKSWPLSESDAPKTVEFIQAEDPISSRRTGWSQFIVSNSKLDNADQLNLYLGSLNRLSALVISPYREISRPTSDLKSKIADAITMAHNESKDVLDQFVKVSSFFSMENTASDVQNLADDISSVNSMDLTVTLGVRPTAPPELIKYGEKLIVDAFRRNGISVAVNPIKVSAADSEQNMKFLSNRMVDFRLATVVTGTSYTPWMAKMMFCSNLGIQFPDPTEEICSLANSPMTSSSGKEFDQIVEKQKTVLPLFRSGSAWYFSDDLDYSMVSPFASFPSLDLLRTKK